MAEGFVRVNMGMLDRAIRIITGCVMMYFGFVDQSLIGNTVVALIVGFFGIISIAFAYLAFCPIYTLGNVNTLPKTSE